jgi:hypothetical protein
MIDFTEIQDGETWELFARDFLSELGFFIETSPDRGADAGKDLLVSERLKGNLGLYDFRWLVSCKNFAVSGKSVNEDDEKNIIERIESFEADGFIGIYSTVPSSGLNTRLKNLRDKLKIKDFRIFDGKLIENHLIRVGFSTLLLRYLPESYSKIRPLALVAREYLPLECKVCRKDLLRALYEEEYSGIIVFASEMAIGENEESVYHPKEYTDIYFVCKGEHDRQIIQYFKKQGKITSWDDLSDLAIPLNFVKFIMSQLNRLREGTVKYSDEAFDQLKNFVIAMSQKVLRETNVNEIIRVNTIRMFDGF